MSYGRTDHIEVYELAESYKREARRCGCGSPMARTSTLHCCHVCYGKERDYELHQMTYAGEKYKKGRLAPYKHYAARG